MDKKITLFAVISLIVSLFALGTSAKAAPREVIGLVREDCAGYSNCFNSLASWQASYGGIDFGACAQGDLVCADKKATAKIDGAWAKPDTTRVTIQGWITDAAHNIRIYTTPSARHKGKWDDTKYRLATTNQTAITYAVDALQIDGLQIQVSASKSVNHYGVVMPGWLVSDATGYTVQISNNIIKGAFSGGADTFAGIRVGQAGMTAYIFNNILYGWKKDGASAQRALWFRGGTEYVYNNTIFDSGVGLGLDSNPVVIAKNNIASNNGTDYLAYSAFSPASVNNISSDSTSPNPSFRNRSVVFFDPANYDFHLSSLDTQARDQGVDLSSDPNLAFSTDIDSELRSGAWDIGADEYSAQTQLAKAPVRSNGSPSGLLPSDTIQLTLSLNTDIASACKYSTTSNISYGLMEATFATTGGTSHSETISNPTPGPYTYYVKCQGQQGNANTEDYVISFHLAFPEPPPPNPARPDELLNEIGYHSRACGFDIDHDGILGEPSDCQIGNGITPDQPNQKTWYVDCDGGDDVTGTGTGASPFKTIQKAVDSIDITLQNIIAFAGVCHDPSITINDKSGPAEHIGRYPARPNMLIGWDRNANGDYPPHDTSDIAVLDGDDLNKRLITYRTSGSYVSYWELAHFTARNTGIDVDRGVVGDSGFVRYNGLHPQGPAGVASYHYTHDIEIYDNNAGATAYDASDNIIFSMWCGGGNGGCEYMTWSNIKIDGYTGYGWRGDGDLGVGEWLIENVTAISDTATPSFAWPLAPAGITFFRAWGDGLSNVVIRKNVVIMVPKFDPYTGKMGLDASLGVGFTNGNQFLTVRDNYFEGMHMTLKMYICLKGQGPGCGNQDRKVKGLVFENNYVNDTIQDFGPGGHAPISIYNGRQTTPHPLGVDGPFIIRNNIFHCEPGVILEALGNINYSGWGTNITEPLVIANNTSDCRFGRYAAWNFSSDGSATIDPGPIYVWNNLIKTPPGSNSRMYFVYYTGTPAPNFFHSDFNVFDPGRRGYRWQGVDYTGADALAGWRSITGQDLNSAECSPELADIYHLSSTDTCARDRGTPVSGFNIDYEGDTRPQGSAWDIGADELVPGGCFLGDVNCDGQAGESSDIQLVVNVRLGLVTDQAIIQRADLNGDTNVDAADIQAIVNMRLGV